MKLLGMTMHVDAPTEDVFDFMADVDNEADWNPDVRSVSRIGGGPLGVGTEWDAAYRGMGPMRIRLDEYDRPRRLAFSTTGPRLDMRFSFDFAPDPSKADITADAEMQPKGLTKLMTPLFGPMMRRTFAQRPAQLAEGVRRKRSGS